MSISSESILGKILSFLILHIGLVESFLRIHATRQLAFQIIPFCYTLSLVEGTICTMVFTVVTVALLMLLQYPHYYFHAPLPLCVLSFRAVPNGHYTVFKQEGWLSPTERASAE